MLIFQSGYKYSKISFKSSKIWFELLLAKRTLNEFWRLGIAFFLSSVDKVIPC